MSRRQRCRERKTVPLLVGHTDRHQRLDRAFRVSQRVHERRRLRRVVRDQGMRDRQSGSTRFGELQRLDLPTPQFEGMAHPQRLQTGAERDHGRRRLRLDVVVELLRRPAYRPHVEVPRPSVPGGAYVIEGDAMIRVADLTLNAPVLDVNRDATRAWEVLRVEAEGGDVALVQLEHHRIGMLVVVVGDNQYGVRHRSHPQAMATRMESRNGFLLSIATSSCDKGSGPGQAMTSSTTRSAFTSTWMPRKLSVLHCAWLCVPEHSCALASYLSERPSRTWVSRSPASRTGSVSWSGSGSLVEFIDYSL